MTIIEFLLSPAVLIPVVAEAIVLFFAIKWLPSMIVEIKEDIAANKAKKAYEAEDEYHEGCESEGHILHPEKTGDLKSDENPFEH